VNAIAPEEAPMHPTFRWLERGEGEPIVLLHGLMGRMDHWDTTLQALAAIGRPIAPDVPILDEALADPSVGGLTEHVRALLDALDIDRAVVGGNSLGGHLAIELALGHPQRVSGLVLTGSSGLFERSFTRGVPHVPTTAFVQQKMEDIFYDTSLVTPAWVEAVRRTLTTRPHARRILQVARSAKRSNVESRLGRIAVPTLVLWGKDDRITPPDIAERFAALIPNAELVFIANCGHAPMLEQPGVFNAVLEDWLQDTRARRLRAAGEVAR
jgi:2-hydroxy-6-oxonona-2,4-dienedioate hydrolase